MTRIAIVGGGPAGAATAITLARAGHHPLLLEREPGPSEKVCGEFLGEDAATLLRALGCDLAALGAVAIRRALFGAGRDQAELDLPFRAWGLPRATLDAALLDRAAGEGAEIRLGTAVAEALPDGPGWRLRLATGREMATTQLILATGKHELRGLRRPARGGWIGVKLPLLGEAPEEAVVLLGCAGGYAGLQARPGGGANLCAALDPGAAGVAQAARSAAAFLAHVARGSALADRLLGRLRPVLDRPLTVGGVPYGFLYRGQGPYRVGDQAAVIPSFCGDGVAMALASGLAAAGSLQAGRPASLHHAGWAMGIGGGMHLAGLMAMLTRRAPRLLVAGVRLAPLVAGWAARRTRLGHARA